MILYDFMKKGVPNYEKLLPNFKEDIVLCGQCLPGITTQGDRVSPGAIHGHFLSARPPPPPPSNTSPISGCSLARWLDASILVRAAILRRYREGKRDAEQPVSHSESADKIRDSPGLVGLLSDSLDHQLRPTHLRE